jgi:hypothetical protein
MSNYLDFAYSKEQLEMVVNDICYILVGLEKSYCNRNIQKQVFGHRAFIEKVVKCIIAVLEVNQNI